MQPETIYATDVFSMVYGLRFPHGYAYLSTYTPTHLPSTAYLTNCDP